MHDIVELESRGIPGVFVATTHFVGGAEVQARALGADPAAVYVEHPIQDRTDQEMIAIADATVERLLTEIIAG